MNPDFKSDVLAAVTIVYAKAPSYGWIRVCSINHVTGKMPNSNMSANKLYNTGIRSVLEINNQKIKEHNIIIIIFNFSFQIRCPKTSWAAQI